MIDRILAKRIVPVVVLDRVESAEPLADAFPNATLTLETDVDAAALAEAKTGATADLEGVAYITIGTGIGGGVCQTEGLPRKINARLIEIAVGYFSPVLGVDYAVPPALGQQAGICGACLLAISA